MGVPGGGTGEVAVLVGDDHVALAGGKRRHLEGDVGEAVAAVLGLLGELDVGAIDLLGDLGGVERGYTLERRFLNLLEAYVAAEVVALWCLCLADYDSTARNAGVTV